ncbi:MAG TPA: hypothetical protein VGI05_11185 [Streptosporangiaceae bacterium]|jgi:hypothetical protein
MADPRRLGRRGSYRLGRMSAPPAPRTPWPAAHYPTWALRRRGPVFLWLLACLAGALIVAVGALAGWWFLPFLAGLGTGLAAHYGRLRLRTTLPAAVAVAVVGWGAALAWLALRDGLPEVTVARTIAALAGLPASAAVALAVTLVVAALQAAAGLWLGRALAPGHG